MSDNYSDYSIEDSSDDDILDMFDCMNESNSTQSCVQVEDEEEVDIKKSQSDIIQYKYDSIKAKDNFVIGDDVVVNTDVILLMNKLFKSNIKKSIEISEMFDNEQLREFNHKKKFDIKHTKFSMDRYNLLIRENKFNIRTDPFGWVFDENNEPVHIRVTKEMKLTKTKDEIFSMVMNELVNQKGKIVLNSKTIPSQIFKLLGIDINTINAVPSNAVSK